MRREDIIVRISVVRLYGGKKDPNFVPEVYVGILFQVEPPPSPKSIFLPLAQVEALDYTSYTTQMHTRQVGCQVGSRFIPTCRHERKIVLVPKLALV